MVVDDRIIIVRTRLTSRLGSAVRLASDRRRLRGGRLRPDPATRVVGGGHRTRPPVTDPARIAEFEQRLRPWVDSVTDTVIEIEPSIVTDIRLVENER
ncbi:hypothetical protein [Nocardia sp. NBC_00403]|uniref:hypothetical protein n=1 Tax=Nocardia sp. NBC_00403 TaxID=2975990 RepID=UPI002E1B6CCA